MVLLLQTAAQFGDSFRVAGCLIFSLSMLAVYVASTLSHSFPQNERKMHFFRRLDQAMIYLMVAGTATPLAFEYLNSTGLWIFFALMWILALTGCMSKLFFGHRVDAVAIWIYLLLGWMPFMVLPWLVGVVPSGAMWLILLGGIIYTLGAVFLFLDKQKYYFHTIWHLMVIVGSFCHYLSIFQFVARRVESIV